MKTRKIMSMAQLRAIKYNYARMRKAKAAAQAERWNVDLLYTHQKMYKTITGYMRAYGTPRFAKAVREAQKTLISAPQTVRERYSDIITDALDQAMDYLEEIKHTYIVKWHTGVEDDMINTLRKAMSFADANACYTQRDITIEDEDGNIICMRHWWGCPISDDDDDIICYDPIDFGNYGYYDDWMRPDGEVILL